MAYKNIEDRKAASRKWYLENKELTRQRAKAQKIKALTWLREYKATLKCSHCPEDHPACLDFHHLDPSQKDGTVGDLANSGNTIERIQREIDKCLVLCSNCHRKLHFAERAPADGSFGPEISTLGE